MDLYLVRHGIAEDTSPTDGDSNRALTAEGKKKLRKVLRVAATAGVAPALIIASPYLRAVETAEIAVEVLGCKEPVAHSPALIPGADPAGLWEEVRLHRDLPALMLVSHEPLLSRSVAFLLRSPALAVDVKKGSILRLDFAAFGPQPHGILRWMLIPKLAEA